MPCSLKDRKCQCKIMSDSLEDPIFDRHLGIATIKRRKTKRKITIDCAVFSANRNSAELLQISRLLE